MLAAVFSSDGGVTDGSRADGASSPPPPRREEGGGDDAKATRGLTSEAKQPPHGEEPRPSSKRSLVSKMLQRRLRPLPPVVGIKAPAAEEVRASEQPGAPPLMTGEVTAVALEPSQFTASRVAAAPQEHVAPDGGGGSDDNNNHDSSCSLVSVAAASLSQFCPMDDEQRCLQQPGVPHPLPDEVMSALAQKASSGLPDFYV